MLVDMLLRFLIVGGLAFALHWSVVVLIVSQLKIMPVAANVAGFAVAFMLSYLGHKNWTFSAREQAYGRTFFRFAGVAVFGFAINEGLYAFLLHSFALDYRICLVFTLTVAAVATFVLSRLWAFDANRSIG